MTETPKSVRPRDAASLLIYREGTYGPEVVMGRRSDRARFKPGVYVFPGGGLEAADARVTPLSPLAADIASKIAVRGSVRRAHALALAAIRETYEETGLIVGDTGDVGASSNPSWAALRARGFAPALAKLTYLGRAITPSAQPIRFHARFFAVAAQHVHGDFGDEGELSDLQWVPIVEATKFEVMGVTLLMLESLTNFLSAPQTYRAPFLSFQRGKKTLQWA